MLTIVLLALWCLYTPSASAQHLLGSHSNAKELEALQKLKLLRQLLKLRRLSSKLRRLSSKQEEMNL